MLTRHNDLLISDVKNLRYEYVPQTHSWRSTSERSNKANRIVTVSRLELKNNTIHAKVQQYYSNQRNTHDDDLVKEDTRNISFVDKEFAKKLISSSKK